MSGWGRVDPGVSQQWTDSELSENLGHAGSSSLDKCGGDNTVGQLLTGQGIPTDEHLSGIPNLVVVGGREFP